MNYDHELVLISRKITSDELGNQIPIESRTPILCKVKSIGRNEFYNAAASGLKPEHTFVIHAFEYGNEKLVEFEGVKYNVLRTYQSDIEEVELICEKVIGH